MGTSEHWPNGDRVWVTRRRISGVWAATSVDPAESQSPGDWTEVVPVGGVVSSERAALRELYRVALDMHADANAVPKVRAALVEAKRVLEAEPPTRGVVAPRGDVS